MSGTLDIAALAEPFPAASEAAWRLQVEKALKGAGFETLVGRTADGIAIQPLYPPRDEAVPVAGARAGKPWGVSALVDDDDAERANAQALADLEGGCDGLTLVFAGSRSARGFGIAADAMMLAATLAGVDFNMITLRLDAGPEGRAPAEAMAALVRERNLSADTLRIDWGLDPIGQDGAPDAAPIRQLREAGFRGPFLRADGRPFHEAGASEAQELAAMVAVGVAALRLLERAGLPLDEARRAVSFVAVADTDAFLTIAKMRALRRLWARVEEACGLTPAPIALHAETAWRMLTRRDVNTNLLRNTIAVFAAAIGGADSICCLPFTQAHGLPDAFARRTARNVSAVLAEEAHLWRVADPAAGAGGLEALTDELCETAWALFQEIERERGIVASLCSGRLQERIARMREARLATLSEDKMVIIGTTRFANKADAAPPVLASARSGAQNAAGLPSMRLSEAFEREAG